MKRKAYIVTGIIAAAGAEWLLFSGGEGAWPRKGREIVRYVQLKLTPRPAKCTEASWESVRQAVASCQVLEGFQAHSQTVSVLLSDGRLLCAKEPKIDDVLHELDAAESKCGDIPFRIE